MMRFALFDNVSHSSKRSFSNVLGDTAIDFDIAPPITDSSGNHVFHVYVMQESGDVWVLQCNTTLTCCIKSCVSLFLKLLIFACKF